MLGVATLHCICVSGKTVYFILVIANNKNSINIVSIKQNTFGWRYLNEMNNVVDRISKSTLIQGLFSC